MVLQGVRVRDILSIYIWLYLYSGWLFRVFLKLLAVLLYQS